ncbi:uncharacterized protein LOC103844877 [Brassica rapa]|uniref:uncharacterized protein LOC103844877 n=1 Tax=Brassica campestris TaxID=3711 RepID=UPI00142D877A|nr:uncharacterized protein LOC103844877 [Brassica rapa]
MLLRQKALLIAIDPSNFNFLSSQKQVKQLFWKYDVWTCTLLKGENMETKKEEVTPLKGILCLKSRQDMKRIEETEDCFILDFNPFDSFDVKNLSFAGDHEGDKDLAIIHESGQVACRDFPHPRHLCLNFPFGSTPNATHCHLCYCCICDKPAPCAQWMSSHCSASADSMEWRTMD